MTYILKVSEYIIEIMYTQQHAPAFSSFIQCGYYSPRSWFAEQHILQHAPEVAPGGGIKEWYDFGEYLT